MELFKLGYIGYESPTYATMAEYGPAVFGFGLNETIGDGSVYLTTDDEFFRIAVHPGEETRVAYLGWEAQDRYAFEGAVENLRSHGIEVTVGDAELEEKRGAFGVAQFKDPAGWPQEIYYARQVKPASWIPGRGHEGFVTRQYGMHTILATADLDPMDAFCHTVMQFNFFGTGNNTKGGGSFWRPKRSVLSHSIAYVKDPRHVYGNTSVRAKSHHTSFYCKSADDVGLSYDLVRARKEHVLLAYGKHGPDPVVSFYSMTPGGFALECIAPPIEMPQETFVQIAIPGSYWGQERDFDLGDRTW